MALPPLPPGFTLDGSQSATPPPPPGFHMDQQAPGASSPLPSPSSVPPPPPGFQMENTLPLTNWHDAAAAEIQKRQASGIPVSPSVAAAVTAAYRTQFTGAPLPAENETLQEQAAKAAPDNTVLQNFGGAVGKTLGNTAIGVVGTVAPQTALHLRQDRDAAYASDPNSIAAHTGNLLAGVVESTPAMLGGPVGLAYSAAGAGGNARVDVAEQRAEGKQVSGGAEAAAAVGSAGLDFATNYLASKLLGKVGGNLMKSFGADAAKAIAAGDKAALAQILMKAGVSAVGKEAAGNTGIAIAHQVAQNAIDKYAYDPARNVFAGVPEAGVDGFITTLLLSPIAALKARSETVHEGLRQANEVAAPPAPSPELANAVGATETQPRPGPEDFAKIREAGAALRETLKPEGFDRQKALVEKVQSDLAGGEKADSFPEHPLVEAAEPKHRITEGENSRGVPLTFENPEEKALYLATQPRTGRVSVEAMSWLTDRGWKDSEIANAGQELRDHIEGEAKGFTGDTLHINPETEAAPTPASEPVNTPEETAGSVEAKAVEEPVKAPDKSSETVYPTELAGPEAVGKWYGDTFNDKENADTIHTIASMAGDQKFVLADVPPDQVNASKLMPGDTDLAKVKAIQDMTPQERQSLPPAIFSGKGKLMSADGSHRLMAAQQAGDKTIRAYVPESFIGKGGITEAGSESANKVASVPVRPEDGSENTVKRVGPSGEGTGSAPTPELPPRPSSKKIRVPARAGYVALPDPAAIAKGVHDLVLHEGSFADKDVLPAVKRGVHGVRQLVDGAERFFGSGAIDKTADTLRNSLRDSWGKQDLDRIRTEELFKPALELAKTFSKDTNTQAIEAIEAGQPQPDPRMQPYADLLHRLVKKNMADAKAVGIDVSKWDSNADWVGRIFEWPDKAEGNGRFSSLAGAENHLKNRVFDNYGDALAAVEATGGKPKYDNFIETSLAKQVEVRKSIEARKTFNEAEARGELTKLKYTDKLPDGYKYLDDKLSRSLGGGRRYAAPAYVANLLNDTIAPGLYQRLPIWKQWAAVNHAVTAVNLGLSGAHMMNMVTGGIGLNISQAMDNVAHGEFKLAGKNLLRAATAPVTTALLGSKVREQAQTASAHPELEPIVKAIATNGRFNFRSVLDKTSWEQAKEAFDSGNYAGGALRAAKTAWQGISYPLFHIYIPNIKAGVLAIRAETELARMGPTIDQAELTKRMAAHSNLADNILGEVVRENKFQHKVVADAMQGIFMAPNWNEGLVRFLGGTARDYLRAGGDLAKLKLPNLTPNMLAPFGQVMSIMAAGAAVHMMFNKTMPTSLKDYFQPNSGQKDEDGNEIRFQLLTPMKDVPNLLREPKNVLWNKLSPLIHLAHDIAVNRDYHGVELRHEGDPIGKQAEDIGGAVGKALLPFSVQSFQRLGDAETPTVKKLAGSVGLSPVPKVYSQSPALQRAYEVLDAVPGRTRTQAEYERHTQVAKISHDLANPEKASAARGQLRDSFRSGILTQSDVNAIKQRMKYPDPLVRAVRNANVSIPQAMEVWDLANDSEKRAVGPALLTRIRNSKDTAREDKVKFVKQLQADWQRLRLAAPTTEETTDEAD